MKLNCDRFLGLALAAALFVLPVYSQGFLDAPLQLALDPVESFIGSSVTAVPADARVAAHRRLASRIQSYIRRYSSNANPASVPSMAKLMPSVSLAHEAALRQHVPVSLVLAVIHHESRFDEEALSPMGAVGLMQIMPAVARSIATSEGHKAPRWLELFDSRTNIEIGVTLLRRLHDRYGSWDRALAAYNAGSRAFIETGLRDDVRGYVQRVSRGALQIRFRATPA